MIDSQPRPVISAILLQRQDGEVKVFLQTRWKPDTSPTYSGMLEIPAGGIDSYESAYDTLRREVKEECDLNIVRIIDDYQGPVMRPRANDSAFVFKPFLCQQVLETDGGLPWIGFVFVCEVAGIARLEPSEAKDPCWVSMSELKAIVEHQPETIFPLQLPVLAYFVEHADPERMLAA